MVLQMLRRIQEWTKLHGLNLILILINVPNYGTYVKIEYDNGYVILLDVT